jgi:hypothetical protein
MRPLILLALLGATAAAQTPPDTAPPLEVGAVAPDFALPGATRYGFLRDPVRLSDFKGKTVARLLLPAADPWLNDPDGGVP